MADISGLEELEGFIGGCLVDSSSGLVMGKQGADKFDLDTAAAGNTEVVRAKIRTMRALGIKGGIEDILITLDDQYHLCICLRLIIGNFSLAWRCQSTSSYPRFLYLSIQSRQIIRNFS